MDPRSIVAAALREGRSKLLEHEALALVEAYGVRVPGYRLARSPREAAEAAREIGFPVALKIVSPDIVHKSDVGGVVLGLGTPGEVEKAYSEVIERVRERAPGARVVGVLVQAMAPPGGVELVVGAVRDPVFGPAVMFGLGGIFVEVFRDVSFRVSPFTRRDAEEMIREVRAYRILRGVRGLPPRDIGALVDIVMAVQRLMEENPEVRGLDINPVLSYPEGALAVDARVVLGEGAR
ncbi:acetyl-CoA synthetase [Pyrodictium occultum]|uniref:Acetyl-CoA synthetase n=1 Tax=Pyrodictium occultum TaxID=2309 RepID=A0A0V8RXJ4_PYROC|nr:acetate--CoA ligase family protein [Pyrodictium occultum]KSW12779.1 acetyl-CoA synthetase [Pyrodictium occultum]